MSSLITALDNHTSKQIGENGHTEYTWSNNIREKILQFHFQLVRTHEDRLSEIDSILRDILNTLKNRHDKFKDNESAAYLSLLYRMIGSTRDIVDGKGEYSLTYMMIYTWYDFYPVLSMYALKCLFHTDETITHQYGSWKDIKQFCHYCLSKNPDNSSQPLILIAIELMNNRIRYDKHLIDSGSDDISLVSKWVPREKSKYSWLFHLLATEYFSQYFSKITSQEQVEKAQKKCYTEYRKLISSLNRKLDTLQIKQCSNSWSDIQFKNVTSISFSKQKEAFLNVKKNVARFPDREDRVKCAENFTDFIQTTIKEGKEIKGKRVGMGSFTQQAIDLLRLSQETTSTTNTNATQIQIDLLNSQWRDNSTQSGSLGKMIAMVDVSASMDGDPINAAIALGIRIAAKSVLGKRVMTFSSTPSWVNLDNYDDFVSQVNIIKEAPWGMNTNFYSAMQMILDAIEENRLLPEDVQDMVLVILSDMQMDDADDFFKDRETLYESINTLYKDAGNRVHGKPYKPPHIIFWNLRSTSGFPTLSTQPNVSMLSGFSASFLNLFCEKGLESLEFVTPWAQLERILENERYNIMNNYITNYLQK